MPTKIQIYLHLVRPTSIPAIPELRRRDHHPNSSRNPSLIFRQIFYFVVIVTIGMDQATPAQSPRAGKSDNRNERTKKDTPVDHRLERESMLTTFRALPELGRLTLYL